jgi:hypothetical protein
MPSYINPVLEPEALCPESCWASILTTKKLLHSLK